MGRPQIPAPGQAPGRASSQQDFADALTEFFRAARRARGRAGQAAGILSLAQYQLLDALRGARPLPVGELARAAGVAQPTATRMITTLARRGTVTRTRNDEDRRLVLVDLTPRGAAELECKHREIEEAKRVIAGQLSPSERAQAAALLHRLARVIEEEL